MSQRLQTPETVTSGARRSFPAAPALLATALLLSTACTGSTPPAAAGPPDRGTGTTPAAGAPTGPPAAAQAALTTCYRGTAREMAPDGSVQRTLETLLERRADPSEDRIVERSARIEADGTAPTAVYTAVYTPGDGTFRVQEAGGAYSGTGSFRGERWSWDAWEGDYTLESGIRVHLRAERSTEPGGDEVLRVERRAYAPDGGLALTLEEELHRVPADDCSRMPAPSPSPPGR